MAAKERALIHQGNEQELANRIANPLAGSPIRYTIQNGIFGKNGLKDSKINPLSPSIPEIASFVNKLFKNGQSLISVYSRIQSCLSLCP